MQFLQQALDDPEPRPCGRCSVCTAACPAPGARPGAERSRRRGGSTAARTWSIEPRKLWPSGLPGRKGKHRRLRRGPGAGVRRRPGLGRGAVPLFVARGRAGAAGGAGRGGRGAGALAAQLGQRPVAVVPMPSAPLPAAGRLAGRACGAGGPAAAGRRRCSDRAASDGGGRVGVRARDLLARTSVRDGVIFDGPVLLVDDTVRTRWTLTVASALLAEAGATQVLPLAIHLLP